MLTEQHAQYAGWVLGIARRNAVPVAAVTDENGDYTNELLLCLPNWEPRITVVVPEPPADWELPKTQRSPMTPAVQAMLTDNHAPTAPLDEFLAAYTEDDNLWWRISDGHRLNLFEAAVEWAVEVKQQGWAPLGTHVDCSHQLEFGEEVDEGGLPKWERVSRD
jgi:hypothetical protein